ncbi:hypothetical protein HanRHA438_Chr01g0019061 [Helianthus annuus]|uniref:Uncharacterized protein n=1 Tax=Helianthus annuus TaxID=4232 RepID=A0A251VMS1_HELAN|nr:hypothetical protein HanXRQr2_Chr01g0018581 [Helianthus annuus]KAJ0611377.1 hypothetical protein HanHA300_Chr01g0014961 [Helianthus annuus]KAJ0622409.1 hypothetical protein HanIR_Chr01g0020221 [Helianthus annuus]KAJ0626676.1 hypothetical protein HanHA89_Chr01g0016581 [Helianthus annuus]KAJ0783023.1 hypothetical protein HanLR1_Chr01g0015511 [Helianthus annuus]
MLSFVRKMKELLQLPRPKPSVGSVVVGKVSSSVSKTYGAMLGIYAVYVRLKETSASIFIIGFIMETSASIFIIGFIIYMLLILKLLDLVCI